MPTTEPLCIRVSSGDGVGRTRLAAFDAALRAAGVADFNLLRLSSVIPPGSAVVPATADQQIVGGFGDRLYCVYAAAWATTPGTEVWAGIAWSRRLDGSGAGLFVEHTGTTETDLRHQLEHTLDDMDEGRHSDFAYDGDLVHQALCTDRPACALVIATYAVEGWGAR